MARDFIEILRDIRGKQLTTAEAASDRTCIYGDITWMYTTLSSVSSLLEQIVANIVSITAVGDNIDAVNSLYADKATLDSLYADKATLDSLFADKAKLDSLFADKAALDSLYADKAALDSLFADKATLDSLFTDKATLDSIYADKAKLDSIFADKSTLDSLFSSLALMNDVNNNIANIDIVALNDENVTNVGANIDSVNTTAANIDKVVAVGTNIDSVVAVADNISGLEIIGDDLLGVGFSNIDDAGSITDAVETTPPGTSILEIVSDNIVDVLAVGTNIDSVNTVSSNSTNINQVAADTAVINDVASNPLRQAVLDAGVNVTTVTTKASEATNSATAAQLSAWEAEAKRLTAESYATEPEDVPVKIVTSNGNGTFTYTPTSVPIQYSALHWKEKAQAVSGSDIMQVGIYDVNENGIVDNSEELQYFKKHGIVAGCVFSVNGIDSNNYDVSSGVYYINGTKYEFSGVVGRPSLGGAGSFANVHLTSAGIADELGVFVTAAGSATKLEVATYAKQTASAISITGNSKDDSSSIMFDMYRRMKYFDQTKFKNGAGVITASGTPLKLNIGAGDVNSPGGKFVSISAATNIDIVPLYNVAGVETIHAKELSYAIDNNVYDNGTDLVSVPAGKYVSHTLSRSIRSGTNYLTYGKTTYDYIGAAESAIPDLGIFGNTIEGSFVEPLAIVITREGVPNIIEIVDVRAGREANTIDSITGKTIPSPASGNIMKYNGIKWVAEAPSVSAGQGVSYYLGNNIVSGDNYDLTDVPAGGAEVAVGATVNSTTSPVFIERFISPSLGGTQIDGGQWTFKTYASVNATGGVTTVTARVNKSVTKAGTITSSGTGQTRTFTASEAGTFLVGDADASILNATLIQTPTETFWIDSFISDTVVTATTEGIGYVNEVDVGFDMYYKLFSVTTDEINLSSPTLFENQSIQQSFSIEPDNKILVAYFAETTAGTNKVVSLYKNGSEHYSHIDTPLILRHNSLAGLNTDNYLHLTAAEKAEYDGLDGRVTTLEGNIDLGLITEAV